MQLEATHSGLLPRQALRGGIQRDGHIAKFLGVHLDRHVQRTDAGPASAVAAPEQPVSAPDTEPLMWEQDWSPPNGQPALRR